MQAENIQETIVNIKVIGIGGGGNSVLKRIADEGKSDMELIAVNTDKKQLDSVAEDGIKILQIGENVTRGLGSGGKVILGQEAAVNDKQIIQEALAGADLVFITAGMGGGTGTGASHILAQIAREMGILTIGVVTMPFSFEGSRKKKTAMAGIKAMQPFLDALIIIQNDKLMELNGANKRVSLLDAFHMADNVLKQAIRCVTELILTPGIINVDFADIRSVFTKNSNTEALLGIGQGSSAIEAVKKSIESPLIERTIKGARGVVLNITGDNTMSLLEINEATKFIYENTSPEVDIILGTVVDETLAGKVKATIIATDFEDDEIPDNAGKTAEEKNKITQDNDSVQQTAPPDLPAFMKRDVQPKKNKTIFDIEEINKKLS